MTVSDGNGQTAREKVTARPQVLRSGAVWIPAVVGAVAGLASGIVLAGSVDSGYEATGTAFVALDFPTEELDPFSGSQFVTQRIGSYAQLGESPEVLQLAADDVPGRTQSDLVGQVEVSAVPGTVLLRVTARDSDSRTATRIANSVMTHLDAAVGDLESGAVGAASPIGLAPVQPPIVAATSSRATTLAMSLAGLVGGALIGAIAGWSALWLRARGIRRATSSRRSRKSPAGDTDQRRPVSDDVEPELSKR